MENDDRPRTPRQEPMEYAAKPDSATKGAFRISGLAIGMGVIVFGALIALVVWKSGGG